jgi:glycosyltransferase involved in cell wall biosynthesis
VSPSLEEGFGLPAVEAAAAGTALFVSDIYAYREVPVDGAVLVPPYDVDEWAKVFREASAGDLKPARLRFDAPTWDTWRSELGRLLDSLRMG